MASRAARQRDMMTPEGVRLPVILANRSARLGAALIDIVAILVVLIAGALGLIYSGWITAQFVWAAAGLAAFVFRVAYFPLFEYLWDGRTPGKWALGMRVIGRDGAPLDGRMVLARNLVREVEMWMPLTYILLGVLQDWLTFTATFGWILAVSCVIFLNKDRMRLGDLVAGTWVIEIAKPVLFGDLLRRADAVQRPAASPALPVLAGLQFTPEQLDAYGEKELNILADVLHQSGTHAHEKVATVARAIKKKIAYEGPPSVSNRVFLEAYYGAFRRRMERDVQWGKRRRDKFDRAGDAS